MQSRFLKGLTLALVALALPAAVFAQNSRVEGLNVQGEYIKDYTNIYSFSSCLTSVGNLVYGEFGATPFAGAGIVLAPDDRAVGAVLGNLWDGRYGIWSIHIREHSPTLGQGNTALHSMMLGTLEDPDTDPDSHESFDLMWGKKFGTTSLGLRLNRKNFVHKETGVTTDQKGQGEFDRNVTGFGGAVGFEINPKTSAEVGILYQQRKFTDPTTPGTVAEDDGGTAYLLSARAMWQWQPNVMVVPLFKFASYDLSTTSTTGGVTTKTEEKLTGWQAGLAGNWTLNQNDLFVLGATFASATDDQTTANQKFTESAMPQVFAALETHVNPWLTLRFGANKQVFRSTKNEDGTVTPADITEESLSDFTMNLGAGVKLGSLQFDGVLANDFFNNPTSYMFGTNGNFNGLAPQQSLFSRVTATYSF